MAVSHPLRVRGLKQEGDTTVSFDGSVAPFTGAWIETNGKTVKYEAAGVAPFTGAWIETLFPRQDIYYQ